MKSDLVCDAIRLIYPDIQGGFSYWETKPDGTDWSRPIDGLVWENTIYPKPTITAIRNKMDIVTLAASKLEKLERMGQKLMKKIHDRYPIYKNINLASSFLVDDTEAAFISEKISAHRTKQSLINSATVIADVDSISED